MLTKTAKLSVWAPATPGAMPSIVGVADTMAEARAIAKGFKGRLDLKWQDVLIRTGQANDGKIIERCGPPR